MADGSNPSPVVLTAEAGYTTTEFWLAIAANGAALTSAVLVDFGVVALTAAQKADITAVALFTVTTVTAVYALARSLRKKGTTA